MKTVLKNGWWKLKIDNNHFKSAEADEEQDILSMSSEDIKKFLTARKSKK